MYQYPPQPHWRPPPPTGPHWASIAGLVSGIVGLVILPILFSPFAIVFGSVGISESKHRHDRAGLGPGIVAIALGIVGMVFFVAIIYQATHHHPD